MKAARKPMQKTLALPSNCEQLHPKAAELLKALNVAKRDSHKRLDVRQSPLPQVRVTKDLAERAAKAFDVIVRETETLGILFAKSQSKYDGGHFRKGYDRLYFKIEEDFVEKGESGRGRSDEYWSMRTPIPSGFLAFTFQVDRYGPNKPKRWEEDAKTPLERLLPQIVQEVRKHFAEAQERRERETIEREKQRVEQERRWREYQEKEAIRLNEERIRKHKQALEAVPQNRRADLIKAAEWWHLHQTALEFIATCEKQWHEKQAGQLTSEQQDWLSWARQAIASLSPFEIGYPDPTKDGAFDPATIPFGGPYPLQRNFPQPPTMPVAPSVVTGSTNLKATGG